jgi:hypothetical protein
MNGIVNGTTDDRDEEMRETTCKLDLKIARWSGGSWVVVLITFSGIFEIACHMFQSNMVATKVPCGSVIQSSLTDAVLLSSAYGSNKVFFVIGSGVPANYRQRKFDSPNVVQVASRQQSAQEISTFLDQKRLRRNNIAIAATLPIFSCAYLFSFENCIQSTFVVEKH